MTIAEQIATPTPPSRTRPPRSPLQPVPDRRPGLALVRVVALIAVTSLGAALLAGTVAIGMMMFASSMGG